MVELTPCSSPKLQVSVEGGGDVETNHNDHGGVEDPGPAKHGGGSPQPVLHRQHHVDPLEHKDRRPEEEGKLGRALHLRPVRDRGERLSEDVVEDDRQRVELADGG